MLADKEIRKSIIYMTGSYVSKNFQGGGGIEEKFIKKMFVDTRINACTHKN